MLILTRRIGEKIMIGDETCLTVLSIKGNHIQIGISAPRSVAIAREEIYQGKKRFPFEDQAAAKHNSDQDIAIHEFFSYVIHHQGI